MAHFAKLDDNNIVKQVIVVNNNELLDDNGDESEQKGIDFCISLLGGNWLQTSYSGSFRKHFSGVGYFYDNDLDAFIPPKPYESWILDEDNASWMPPVEMPTGNKLYKWNEEILNWDEFDIPELT
jgi:hypothetical protein